MTFRLPRDPETYTITARAVEDKTLDFFGQTLYTTALAYTITPEPPEGSLTLRDFAEPIRPSSGDSSVGIIGGADGIAAFGRGKDVVCSQVRREEKRRVTWTLVFHEKRLEDKMVTLLAEKKERNT